MFLKDGEFLQSEQPETYQLVSKKNSNRNKKKISRGWGKRINIGRDLSKVCFWI